VGVHVRSQRTDTHYFGTFRFQHRGERGGALGIVVDDEVREVHTLVVEVDGKVPGLLRHPSVDRVRRHAGDVTRREPTWMKKRTWTSTTPPTVHALTLKKSLALKVAACRARNLLHVPGPRFGPVSSPFAFGMFTTAKRDTLTPRFFSSPRTRV
jgi:hypothetical protein